jgi:hypothetical protein
VPSEDLSEKPSDAMDTTSTSTSTTSEESTATEGEKNKGIIDKLVHFSEPPSVKSTVALSALPADLELRKNTLVSPQPPKVQPNTCDDLYTLTLLVCLFVCSYGL